MAIATHLADKSALARMGKETVARRSGPMIEAGLIGTSGLIELEVRFPARSHAEITDQVCEWVVPQGSVS